jgi:hypothetical protein
MFSATPSVSSLRPFLRSLACARHLANVLLARASRTHSHRQKIMPRPEGDLITSISPPICCRRLPRQSSRSFSSLQEQVGRFRDNPCPHARCRKGTWMGAAPMLTPDAAVVKTVTWWRTRRHLLSASRSQHLTLTSLPHQILCAWLKNALQILN